LSITDRMLRACPLHWRRATAREPTGRRDTQMRVHALNRPGLRTALTF